MRRFQISSLLILLVLTAGLSYPLPAQQDTHTGRDSITVEELRDHLYYLASDYLKGRDTGSTDYLIAAQYAASQFLEAGLKTVVNDADGKGTFMQPVEYVVRKYTDQTQATLEVGGDETSLKNGESILVLGERAKGGVLEPTESVFMGYGIEEPNAGWNDYAAIDPAGKVVFIVPGAPTAEGKSVLPQDVNNKYASLNGVIVKVGAAVKHRAAALVIVLAGESVNRWEVVKNIASREIMTLKSDDSTGLIPAPMPILLMHPKAVAKAFEGSGYNPVSGEGECKPKALENVKVGLRIVKELARSESSPNVVGLIEGSDPKLKDQYIVIGAHLDHVGVQRGEIYNGASDNGSGSVAVLETAEALAMTPPRRSVICVLYSGEEKGLFGSRSFVDNCPVPIENIELSINLDMLGRDNEDFPKGIYAIGSDRRSKELKQIIIETDNNTVKLPLDFRYDENDPDNFWHRSDQINFHDKGIPVVFFSCGLFPDLHTPADDADKIDYEKIKASAQLCYELIEAIGNRDEKLKIDVQ